MQLIPLPEVALKQIQTIDSLHAVFGKAKIQFYYQWAFYDNFAGKGVLSKLVYDLGGTGGVGKDIGVGCTNYTACKFVGVEFIVDIVGESLCSLFL